MHGFIKLELKKKKEKKRQQNETQGNNKEEHIKKKLTGFHKMIYEYLYMSNISYNTLYIVVCIQFIYFILDSVE